MFDYLHTRVALVTFDDQRRNVDIAALRDDTSHDREALFQAIDEVVVDPDAAKDVSRSTNGSIVHALEHTLSQVVDYRRLRQYDSHGQPIETKVVLITDKDVSQEYNQTGVVPPFWQLEQLNQPGTPYHASKQALGRSGEVSLFVVALSPFVATANLGGRPSSARVEDPDGPVLCKLKHRAA